jgi:amino-acid N-acetyltransferase
LDLPDPTVFRDLMNDVALSWLLGMKIVLVVGCRHQIEKRVRRNNNSNNSKDDGLVAVGITERHHGLRVTDEETLRIVKEEAGYVRFEVERQLARSLRVQGGTSGHGGGSSSSSSSSSQTKSSDGGISHGYYDGNVVSGNFYSAQPFGILDGVDYK